MRKRVADFEVKLITPGKECLMLYDSGSQPFYIRVPLTQFENFYVPPDHCFAYCIRLF